MGAVANQMLMASNSSIHTSFHVYFVPQKSVACVHLLKDHLGLSGRRGTGDAIDGNNVGNTMWQSITFGEFELGLIPFDTVILSLEMGNAFKQCHVDGDYSSLNAVAMALLEEGPSNRTGQHNFDITTCYETPIHFSDRAGEC
mmetsp:Transcript_21145/g.35831  ORF Transcript_21145/g.35831 Transcript_21145/m.35831 type:complete len:143 (-) Transcript_21145:176-604(-)